MEPPFASVLTKHSGADEVCPEREIIAKCKHLFVVEENDHDRR